jgi:hypothetical protein
MSADDFLAEANAPTPENLAQAKALLASMMQYSAGVQALNSEQHAEINRLRDRIAKMEGRQRPRITPEDPARECCPNCGLWTFKNGRNAA